jgi:hypothetical protein
MQKGRIDRMEVPSLTCVAAVRAQTLLHLLLLLAVLSGDARQEPAAKVSE